jgi:hypothetical protein
MLKMLKSQSTIKTDAGGNVHGDVASSDSAT